MKRTQESWINILCGMNKSVVFFKFIPTIESQRHRANSINSSLKDLNTIIGKNKP